MLDDSRSPTRLHLAGAYRLSDELRAAGTIPQLAGSRKCSAKAKGHVIDTFLDDVTGSRPFLHVIGYEAGEIARARRDATYDTRVRTGIYPLINWDWDRAACEDYIYRQTGARWPKSACTYCPFAFSTPTGRERVLALYLDEPAAAIRDLTLEHVALALNPRQSLVGRGTLAALLVGTGRHDHLLARFGDHLAVTPWQVYEVRRVIRPCSADHGKPGQAFRSVRILATGSQTAMHGRLTDLAERTGQSPATGADGIARAWLRHRDGRYPDAEHFLVAAQSGP